MLQLAIVTSDRKTIHVAVAALARRVHSQVMSDADDLPAIAGLTERLGQQFAERSNIEVLTAVVDAWDHSHLLTHAHLDITLVERSAQARLSGSAVD